MVTINENYQKLQAGYLFPEIGRRVREFTEAHPQAKVIRLGIGDVTRPLPPAIIEAFHRGVDEMAQASTFRGYGPEQGYAFLREAIVAKDYAARGVAVEPEEIFVSDGSKCDSGNIQEIFGLDNVVAVTDPVYPVYVDTNVMAGRSGAAAESGHYDGIVYLPCTAQNDFTPELPGEPVDLIYLCYPNNPTGTVATVATLKQWVDYAREHRSIILIDAAYERFITDPEIPHSIYEVPGAREVAIEFRSLSKAAGFTGTRCAFTVVPRELKAYTSGGDAVEVHGLWNRRHCTKFNGVSYPTQVAAATVYSDEGQAQTQELVNYYMENARLIREALSGGGYRVYGGVNSPYIWLQTPVGAGSWAFFDKLLQEAHIVGTPGAGFGPAGEGYFRISAFADRENVVEALERIGRLS